MASEVLTNYITGTISAISSDGLTLTLTIDSANAAYDTALTDGRIIYITETNSAQGRYRYITGGTVGSTVTIDAPFSYNDGSEDIIHSPFRGLTPAQSDADGYDATAERPIAVGDSFSISRKWSEVESTNADVTVFDFSADQNDDTNRMFYVNDTGITLPNGCVIYDEKVIVNWAYSDQSRVTRVIINRGAAIIFGRQNFGDTSNDDIIGFPSDSCTLIERARRFSSGDTRGAWHMNGGSIITTVSGTGNTNEGIFYRFNGDNNESLRWWNVNITGRLGGRVQGNYTVVLGSTFNANDSNNGPIASLGAAVFNDNTVADCFNAAYFYIDTTSSARNGSLEASSVQDITDRVVRIVETGNADADSTQTLINWSFTELENTTTGTNSSTNLVFFDGNSGGAGDVTLELVKDYKLDFTESNGDAITSDTGSFLMQATGAGTTDDVSGTTTNGSVASQRLLAYDRVFDLSSDTQINDLSGMTAYQPWGWAVKYRGYTLLQSTTDLDAPPGQLDQSFPRLVDTNYTAASDSEVDDLTELETAEELYNRADLHKYDNMAEPTRSTQLFSRSGTTCRTTDSSYDVTFDSDASSILSWDNDNSLITIKDPSTGYTGGISSASGTITFHTTIQGEVTADTIAFSGTAPSTIIDTSAEISGTLTLEAGTYTINDADISGLTINRAAGETGTVFIATNAGVTGTADATLGDNVEFQNNLTIEIGSVTGGRLDIFDGDDMTPVHTETTFSADIELNSADETWLTTNNVLRFAWSGPGRTDWVDQSVTIVSGANTVTISNDSLSYPDSDTDFTALGNTDCDYVADQMTGDATAAVTVGDSKTLSLDNVQVNGSAASASNSMELASGDFIYIGSSQFLLTAAATVNSTTLSLSGSLAGEDVADNDAVETFPSGLRINLEDTGTTLNLADGTTNEFIHESGNIRGSVGYNTLLAFGGSNAVDTFGSTGETGVATMKIDQATWTPGNNKSYNIGYLSTSGTGDAALDRIVFATVAGESSTASYNVSIPNSASAFDIGTTRTAVVQGVEGALDDRLLTRENSIRGGILTPVVGSDGTFITDPDG